MSLTYILQLFSGLYGTWKCQYNGLRLIESLFAAAAQTPNFLYESPGGPVAAGHQSDQPGVTSCGSRSPACRWLWRAWMVLWIFLAVCCCCSLSAVWAEAHTHVCVWTRACSWHGWFDTGLTRCLCWMSSEAQHEGEGRCPSSLWVTPLAGTLVSSPPYIPLCLA